MKFPLLLAVLALLLISACGDDSAEGRLAISTADRVQLDCGSDKSGAKRAVRKFFAVLRSGDEQRVLRVLAKGDRFEWITIGSKDGILVDGRGSRRRAAAAVADYGGLPLRVTEFMNIDRPSGTTDFGFFGTWKGKELVGKGALDCNQGRARVLSAGVQ